MRMPSGIVAVLAGGVSLAYTLFQSYQIYKGIKDSTKVWTGVNAVGAILGLLGVILGIAGLALDHEANATDDAEKGARADQIVIAAYVMTFVSLISSVSDTFLNK